LRREINNVLGTPWVQVVFLSGVVLEEVRGRDAAGALGNLLGNLGSGQSNRVEGTVTFDDGVPVEGATVAFTSENFVARSITDASGKYVLSILDAPPGDYRVTISKIVDGASVLPEKYAHPDTSGLTITVRSGRNNVDFALE